MKVGLSEDFFVVEGVEESVKEDVVAVEVEGEAMVDAREESALKSALSSSRAVAVVVDAWESADFRALL